MSTGAAAPASSWSTPWSAGSAAPYGAAACRPGSSSGAAMPTRGRWMARALGVVIAAAGLSGPVAAQDDALIGIGSGTEVRKIELDFQGEHRLTEAELRSQMALSKRPSMVFLHKALGWFPLIGPVGAHPFDPLNLQRDVVRLRDLYHRNGYLDALVTYDIAY